MSPAFKFGRLEGARLCFCPRGWKDDGHGDSSIVELHLPKWCKSDVVWRVLHSKLHVEKSEEIMLSGKTVPLRAIQMHDDSFEITVSHHQEVVGDIVAIQLQSTESDKLVKA